MEQCGNIRRSSAPFQQKQKFVLAQSLTIMPSGKAGNFDGSNKARMAVMDSKLESTVDNLLGVSSDTEQLRKKNSSSALNCINELARFWIEKEMCRRGNALPSGSRIFVRAFGSYGLGVGDGRDVDLILIAPCFVRREEFFSSFVKLLRQQSAVVQNVYAVEHAFVPVIKLTAFEMELDLTFASLGTKEVPQDERQLRREEVLHGMDEKSILSFSGWRVCQFLLDYVPNVEQFQSMLRAVKQWAIRRQIHSKSCGYLGGVSWAILAANVCKMQPPGFTSVSALLRAFFQIYSHWNWALTAVQLHEDDSIAHVDDFEFRPFEKQPLMRIDVPCPPYQNSSFNVTHQTKKVIKWELNQALSVFSSTGLQGCFWNVFFQALEPWRECYDHYAILTATAPNQATLNRWRSGVESKFRPKLLYPLERLKGIISCRLYASPYQGDSDQNGWPQHKWAIGIYAKHDIDLAVAEVFEQYKDSMVYLGLMTTKENESQLQYCTVGFEFVDQNILQRMFTQEVTPKNIGAGGSGAGPPDTSFLL